jgi:hypothetical protein
MQNSIRTISNHKQGYKQKNELTWVHSSFYVRPNFILKLCFISWTLFLCFGWPPAIGRTPIIHSASKKGETSMIMVLVENGVYSLAISPDSGFVEITKNENDGKVSGGIGERTGISCGQILEKRPGSITHKWFYFNQ